METYKKRIEKLEAEREQLEKQVRESTKKVSTYEKLKSVLFKPNKSGVFRNISFFNLLQKN